MVRKFLRKRSKRMLCRKKYKIEKKVRQHNRKVRRDKKKNPGKFRRKDPGVPNSIPFKDKIIEEAVEAKKIKDEERRKRREEIKAMRKEGRSHILEKRRSVGKIEQYVKEAEEKIALFNEKKRLASEKKKNLTDRSTKAFYKEFKKVVEAADVILQILDARDPQGTRCPQIESYLTSMPGKRLVLVLNKADLVPKPALEKWLKYLRQEHPTVLFKSSTQTQSSHLSQSSKSVLSSSYDSLHSSKCIGADVLMQLLKNYSCNKNLKTAITVGVVGLPNVGKSSLINSLKRSKACAVAAKPGHTRVMQEIQLDSKVRLLDSPGIIFPSNKTSDEAAALQNTFHIDDLEDPQKPVEAIFNRLQNDQLMMHYTLPHFNNCSEFLSLLAKKRGKLKKGGLPDNKMAARIVLRDWNSGHIKYYTKPPEIESSSVESSACLVTEFAKEFNLDELDDSSLISKLPSVLPSSAISFQSLGPVKDINMSDIDVDAEMEDVDEGSHCEADTNEENLISEDVEIQLNEVKKSDESEAAEKKVTFARQFMTFDPKTMSRKKFMKTVMKRCRKEKNRNVRRVDDLTDAFSSFSGITEKGEDYDFGDYF